MKIQRVERHQINKNNLLWKEFDDLCFKAKNLYNYANYIQRQKFIKGEKLYKHTELDKMIQNEEPYKQLGSQSAQRLLRLLEKNWKSFFITIKDYSKNPNKYLGKPRLPRYKDKNGRYVCELKNIQFRIENGYVRFSLKRLKSYNNIIKTNIKDKVLGIRIVPKGTSYILEIVYEINIIEPKEFNNRILSIDLGVNNFATCVNNIGSKSIIINGKNIKAVNQYYNKQLSKLRSDLKKRHNKDWSNKMQKITTKRNNKIEYFLHCSSKSIIEYCKGNDINTIVIGLNKTWKQDCKLHKIISQGFVQLPYDKFISKVKYKAEDEGITVIVNEESYSSGTSFLDRELPIKKNYNKDRRIYRGLFKSNIGKLINADANGAYQIMIKVFPNAFVDGIEDVDLHPLRVNIAC